MKQRFPKHLSYDYKLEIGRLPAKANDRLSLRVILPAVFVGVLMVLLGILEMSNSFLGETDSKIFDKFMEFNADSSRLLVNHLFSDYAFIILGLGIIAGAIIAHIRYKKIYFDGRVFDVDFKGVFGEAELFSENLRNYRGVRMRIEFFQFGIMTKNKYIIELEHIDPGKTIPLYISTDSNGIYDIWHYYAKRLEKPTIMDTDTGLKVVETKNLNKSLRNYIVSTGQAPDYMVIPPLPRSFKYVQKDNKVVLVARKAFWDILSVIVSIWLTVYAAALGFVFYNYDKIAQSFVAWKFNLGLAVASLIFVLCLSWLFKKEKIVIKDNRIILIYKFFLLSRKSNEVDIDGLKDIEIMRSPANNRYYLALISQYNVAAFGAKMPLENLQWVKNFLIHEILK